MSECDAGGGGVAPELVTFVRSTTKPRLFFKTSVLSLVLDRSLRFEIWELILRFFFSDPRSQFPILTVRSDVPASGMLHNRVSWLIICYECIWQLLDYFERVEGVFSSVMDSVG